MASPATGAASAITGMVPTRDCLVVSLAFSGRVWCSATAWTTGRMYPGFAMKMDPPEAARHVFYQVEARLTDQVSPAISWWRQELRHRFISPVRRSSSNSVCGLVAEEFNSLFFRNAVNAHASNDTARRHLHFQRRRPGHSISPMAPGVTRRPEASGMSRNCPT